MVKSSLLTHDPLETAIGRVVSQATSSRSSFVAERPRERVDKDGKIATCSDNAEHCAETSGEYLTRATTMFPPPLTSLSPQRLVPNAAEGKLVPSVWPEDIRLSFIDRKRRVSIRMT